MAEFKDRADLQKLIDAQIEETLTLEYKASPSLARDSKPVDELCKDVSAMANSAGGQIIYGVEEDNKTHKPKAVDSGIIDEKITREWLHQILSSRIQPRIDGIFITRISLSANGSGFVITVPQSLIGPHQAPDKKYYKRFELEAKPMEDYEIRDVLRRSSTPDLVIDLSIGGHDKFFVEFPHGEWSKTAFLTATVRNRSAAPAGYAIVEVLVDEDLKISFPPVEFAQVGAEGKAPSKLIVFRRTILPSHVPIFKEGVHESHKGDVPFQLNTALYNSGLIYLATRVQAPGCTRYEEWQMRSNAGNLELKRIVTR
jgi:hypothetical protein